MREAGNPRCPQPLVLRKCARGGFTLIELLVVVSIISLLMSVLLPSMRSAREQAKRVACQANMKQINTTLLTYLTDYDGLPVSYNKKPNGCVCGWCTWNYGGWMGKNPYWITRSDGCFRVPAYQRPLTVYMTKGEVSRPVGEGDDERELQGQPVFKCPSDKISAQWQWSAAASGQAADTYSSYDDVGTSYHMNFYWWYQTDREQGIDHDGDGVIEPTLGTCEKEPIDSCPTQQIDWPCRFRQGRTIWRKYQVRGSSRFVTLVEERCDFALVEGIQELGSHGGFSQHNMAFLDGHVSYMKPDTREFSGVDWTVVDEQIEAAGWN